MKNIATLFTITLLLAACSSKQPGNKQDELKKLKAQQQSINAQITKLESTMDSGQAVKKTVPVDITVLHPQVFKNYIEVQGKVDAQDNVNVNAEMSGVVTSVSAVVGQRVTKGEVLAQLDDKVIREQMAQSQTQIDFTKNLYEKQKNLWSQNIGTQVQLLQAKNNYENAQKQMAVQKSQLDMYRLKSPINGRVDEVDLKVGQSVSPGMSTIRVVNLQDLRVKGQIGETYGAQVNTGDKVDVIFPDANDTLRTRLSYVARVIDPNSRSFNVEIKLPPSKIFRPNMVAVIKVVNYVNPKAIVVPVNVIQKTEEGKYVYVVENNKAKKVPITTGQSYNGYMEITSGLNPGDQLVVTGFEDLDQGDPVEVIE